MQEEVRTPGTPAYETLMGLHHAWGWNINTKVLRSATSLIHNGRGAALRAAVTCNSSACGGDMHCPKMCASSVARENACLTAQAHQSAKHAQLALFLTGLIHTAKP